MKIFCPNPPKKNNANTNEEALSFINRLSPNGPNLQPAGSKIEIIRVKNSDELQRLIGSITGNKKEIQPSGKPIFEEYLSSLGIGKDPTGVRESISNKINDEFFSEVEKLDQLIHLMNFGKNQFNKANFLRAIEHINKASSLIDTSEPERIQLIKKEVLHNTLEKLTSLCLTALRCNLNS